MTTIVGLKTKDGFVMGADMQVTSNGHLRHPDNYEKILVVDGSILISTTGEVGFGQQVLDSVVKEIKIERVMDESDKPLDIVEISRGLAHKNFYFPLQYRRFCPNDFLIAGITESGRTTGYAIGSDGSRIEIKSYSCGGSGGEIAQSIISYGYKEDLTLEEGANLVFSALTNSSKNDVYTNSVFVIYSLNIAEDGEIILKKWNFTEPKPQEVKI